MLLYINCCPRVESRTERLAQAVLAGREREELCLYEQPLVPLDRARLAQRDALIAAQAWDDPMFRWAKQFAAADEIVIAAPYWDLSFPAVLKTYVENIYVTGIVTVYGEDGCPVGLCRAKRLTYVTTSGGAYDPQFSYEYLAKMAKTYFGIAETRLVYAEKLDIAGNNAEEILQQAIDKL